MLKCTKFDLGWGSAPDPARGYSAPPEPLAGFTESTSLKGGEEKEGDRKETGWKCRVPLPTFE